MLSLALRLIGVLTLAASLFVPWYSYEASGEIMNFYAWGVGTGNVMLSLILLILLTTSSTHFKKSYFADILGFFFGLLALILVLVNNPSQLQIELHSQWGFYLGVLGGLLVFFSNLWSVLRKRDF